MTTKPTLILAIDYAGEEVRGRLLSEKYDGCRAYWDGSRLWTRSGRPIDAPRWFTSDWPDTPLDGEVWLGRGTFDRCQGMVRTSSRSPRYSEAAWREARFMVFDLPADRCIFETRVKRYTEQLAGCRYAKAVKHRAVSSRRQMYAIYTDILDHGGEGVMLREPASRYEARRSRTLLRLKPPEETTDGGKVRYKNTGTATVRRRAAIRRDPCAVYCIAGGLVEVAVYPPQGSTEPDYQDCDGCRV